MGQAVLKLKSVGGDQNELAIAATRQRMGEINELPVI
jgi:hypothetical protein